jgi:hypothetical protein
MGCKLETKKILMIGLVIAVMIFATFAPIPITVLAADSDTITITFDPQGNVSFDVSPGSYNFSTIWAGSSKATTVSYFTIYNNGTTNNMTTDIMITDDPNNLAVDEDSPPTGNDAYALRVLAGSVSDTPWVKESGYVDLDSDIDQGGSNNFGLRLYVSNLTQNFTWQTMVVTLRGTTT